MLIEDMVEKKDQILHFFLQRKTSFPIPGTEPRASMMTQSFSLLCDPQTKIYREKGNKSVQMSTIMCWKTMQASILFLFKFEVIVDMNI